MYLPCCVMFSHLSLSCLKKKHLSSHQPASHHCPSLNLYHYHFWTLSLTKPLALQRTSGARLNNKLLSWLPNMAKDSWAFLAVVEGCCPLFLGPKNGLQPVAFSTRNMVWSFWGSLGLIKQSPETRHQWCPAFGKGNKFTKQEFLDLGHMASFESRARDKGYRVTPHTITLHRSQNPGLYIWMAEFTLAKMEIPSKAKPSPGL